MPAARTESPLHQRLTTAVDRAARTQDVSRALIDECLRTTVAVRETVDECQRSRAARAATQSGSRVRGRRSETDM